MAGSGLIREHSMNLRAPSERVYAQSAFPSNHSPFESRNLLSNECSCCKKTLWPGSAAFCNWRESENALADVVDVFDGHRAALVKLLCCTLCLLL